MNPCRGAAVRNRLTTEGQTHTEKHTHWIISLSIFNSTISIILEILQMCISTQSLWVSVSSISRYLYPCILFFKPESSTVEAEGHQSSSMIISINAGYSPGLQRRLCGVMNACQDSDHTVASQMRPIPLDKLLKQCQLWQISWKTVSFVFPVSSGWANIACVIMSLTVCVFVRSWKQLSGIILSP